MTVDTGGTWWKGSEPEDVGEYLRAYAADGYSVDAFRLARCACGSNAFALHAERDEGLARRICSACKTVHFIGDSEEFWGDVTPEVWSCVECTSDSTNVGIGFSLYANQQGVRWLYVGVRCARCGTLGCFADWKVGHGDISPNDE